MSGELTHLDAQGRASMVDVTGKPVTVRRALARARVVGAGPWLTPGSDDDVLGAARLAGIMGAKLTSDLIPLCHPIPLTEIDVVLEVEDDDVGVAATAETVSRTGVEMEALTACALAALSVLHRVLPQHPEARVDDLTLWSKTGGRSGTWQRVAPGPLGMPSPAARPGHHAGATDDPPR